MFVFYTPTGGNVNPAEVIPEWFSLPVSTAAFYRP